AEGEPVLALLAAVDLQRHTAGQEGPERAEDVDECSRLLALRRAEQAELDYRVLLFVKAELMEGAFALILGATHVPVAEGVAHDDAATRRRTFGQILGTRHLADGGRGSVGRFACLRFSLSRIRCWRVLSCRLPVLAGGRSVVLRRLVGRGIGCAGFCTGSGFG